MKIIIVDDHKLIRQCIKSLLIDTPEIEVIGEASNGLELLEMFPSLRPDVILLDINMPEMDGIDTMIKLMQGYNFSNVIVLTMLHNGKTVRKMMELGASGYLLKNCAKEELLNAVLMVGSGYKYISPEITLKILNTYTQPDNQENPKNPSSISKREMEVLKLVAAGLTNEQIADKLFNSKRTIESHRRSMIEKTGTKNSAELVKFALSNGLLSDGVVM